MTPAAGVSRGGERSRSRGSRPRRGGGRARAVAGRRPRRGFTLVELMVVLVVVGLAVGVAAPALPVPGGTGGDALDRVAARLRAARRMAAERGRVVRVRLRRSGEAGTVTSIRAEGPAAGWRGVRTAGVDLAGIRAAGPPAFRFGPLGRATGPTLTVMGPERRRTLRVDPLLGDVEVHRAR